MAKITTIVSKIDKLVNKNFPDLLLIVMPKKHIQEDYQFNHKQICDINVYLNKRKKNFNLIPYKSDRIKILRLQPHEIG